MASATWILEGYNLIGLKAIMNISDMLRYEPKFSLDLIVDVVFPIGEYNSDQALNLGQNCWYGRGAPIVRAIIRRSPGALPRGAFGLVLQ
ncbi:MAG: hypothetical protein U1F61_31260 [Opitutaceae bacterium]